MCNMAKWLFAYNTKSKDLTPKVKVEKEVGMVSLLDRIKKNMNQGFLKDNRYRDYVFLLMIALLHYSAAMVFFAFPIQVIKWGYTTMHVAILAFSMDGVLIAVRPLVKRLIDRHKAQKALVFASFILLVVPIILLMAGRSFPLLILAKAFHGVALSIFIVANLVYVHALFPPEMMRRSHGHEGREGCYNHHTIISKYN